MIRKNIFAQTHGLYFKNMVVTVDGSKNKISIHYKMIGFRNILNNYLIYINFKNV